MSENVVTSAAAYSVPKYTLPVPVLTVENVGFSAFSTERLNV